MPTWEETEPLGPQERGKDFNFYLEVVVADGYFPAEPQAFMKFKGPRRMLFVCPSGDIEYSFNGNTLHGKMVANEPSEKLDFDARMEDKIWVRGNGTIQIHAWHIGV
jgi:hypothetical protein